MDKQALVKKIIAQLARELALSIKAARAAHAEATHEQNKAENKYDTRGLEASYLARGQSRQAAEAEQAIQQFEEMSVRGVGSPGAIDLGVAVELRVRSERLFYFVGPRAGGTEIDHEKKTWLVITPQSPLGRQLMGKKQGERLDLEVGGTKQKYLVAEVW